MAAPAASRTGGERRHGRLYGTWRSYRPAISTPGRLPIGQTRPVSLMMEHADKAEAPSAPKRHTPRPRRRWKGPPCREAPHTIFRKSDQLRGADKRT